MRRPRLKNEGESYYHLYTRTAFQQCIFGDVEKRVLVSMMRKLALFCGLDILTYCIMDNHFHILVHVPKSGEISTEELLKRYEHLYGKDDAKELKARWEDMSKNEATAHQAELEMAALRRRMGDISPFMQALKHRFSIWFRHHHPEHYRSGTIWDSRFGSTLIEGSDNALSTVAAYIDLNPVRAGIVDDPAEYAWSGYGSAMVGNKESRKGLALIYHPYEDVKEVYFTKRIAENYRQLLYIEGADTIPQEEIEKTVTSGGELPLPTLLRCYIRYFTRSMALGSEDFIEDIFRDHRNLFGLKRKSGARPFRGCASWPCGSPLYSARDLLLRIKC